MLFLPKCTVSEVLFSDPGEHCVKLNFSQVHGADANEAHKMCECCCRGLPSLRIVSPSSRP